MDGGSKGAGEGDETGGAYGSDAGAMAAYARTATQKARWDGTLARKQTARGR